MLLLLSRVAFKPDYTIGKLHINGTYFCDTLELPSFGKPGVNRNAKHCIQIGSYRVILSMSPKFGRLLPRLLNVPNHEGILLHEGNSVSDTIGCILVGFNTSIGYLTDSMKTITHLVSLFETSVTRHEASFIQII